MSYDPEKYREKREKVLGIKKRGLGFGTIAMIVSPGNYNGFKHCNRSPGNFLYGHA